MVYLGTKALIGTVFVSAYDGTFYNSSGQVIGGGANPAPPFIYDDALNAVTFTTPLPAGSTVSITFLGLTAQNYTLPQRFHVGGRVNQKIKGLPGAEIGASFSRIFDVDDLQCSQNSGVPALCLAQTAAPGWGFGLVSDTVFGVDAQIPIPIDLTGPGTQPVLFGEVSNSKYSPNYQSVAPVSDNAWIAGVNVALGKANGTIQYQVDRRELHGRRAVPVLRKSAADVCVLEASVLSGILRFCEHRRAQQEVSGAVRGHVRTCAVHGVWCGSEYDAQLRYADVQSVHRERPPVVLELHA